MRAAGIAAVKVKKNKKKAALAFPGRRLARGAANVRLVGSDHTHISPSAASEGKLAVTGVRVEAAAR